MKIPAEDLRPYLLQTLNQPSNKFDELKTPSGVKGFYQGEKPGLKDEELKEAVNWINNAIPLEYMGAAEFEFNSVATSLRTLGNSKPVVRKTELTGKPEKMSFLSYETLGDPPKQTQTVFIIAPEETQNGVAEVMGILAQEPHPIWRMKRPHSVQAGMFGVLKPNYTTAKKIRKREPGRWEKSKVTGWLSLDEIPWIAIKHPLQAIAICRMLGIQFPEEFII